MYKVYKKKQQKTFLTSTWGNITNFSQRFLLNQLAFCMQIFEGCLKKNVMKKKLKKNNLQKFGFFVFNKKIYIFKSTLKTDIVCCCQGGESLESELHMSVSLRDSVFQRHLFCWELQISVGVYLPRPPFILSFFHTFLSLKKSFFQLEGEKKTTKTTKICFPLRLKI